MEEIVTKNVKINEIVTKDLPYCPIMTGKEQNKRCMTTNCMAWAFQWGHERTDKTTDSKYREIIGFCSHFPGGQSTVNLVKQIQETRPEMNEISPQAAYYKYVVG